MDEMDYVMHDHDPSTAHPHQPTSQPHQSGCPYWREQTTRTSPNRNLAAHPQYDPVSNMWFSQPAPSYPWAPPGAPAPATHGPARHGRPASESFYPPGVSGGPGAPNVATQTPLMHNQATPHSDPFGPFPFAFRHPSSAMQRFAPPGPPPAQPNHPASHQASFPAERSREPHPSSRILPPLNPQQPPQQQQQQPNMPSSGESSPSSAAAPGRPSVAASSGSMLSLLEPPLTQPSASSPGAARVEPSQTRDLTSTAPSDADASSTSLPSTPPVPPNTERRRHPATRHGQAPRANNRSAMAYDSDSESDFQDMPEDERQALRFIEQQISASATTPMRFGADVDEARIRAHQLLRGQLSSKRVASRGALSSLQSVEINSLPENERMCVICYNEFGVPNPEGINEAPLRLPKCKHVFGDHCIKKWFEESDSCPYCRDKVPSEPQIRVANYGALSEFLRNTYSQRATSRPHIESRGSSSTVTMLRGDADTYVRLMTQHDENHYDSSPLRAWNAGERRSPPSEAPESRRRTRPRHGSLRALSSSSNIPNNGRPSSFAAGATPPASLQQSPGRERFPPGNHRSYYNSSGAGAGGTSGGRHLPPMMPLDVEPLALGLPPMSNPGHAGFMAPPLANPGPHEQPYPGHPHGGPGIHPFQPPSLGMGSHLLRGPGMGAYYSDFPPGHPMEGPDYPPAPNGSGHHPTPAGEFW